MEEFTFRRAEIRDIAPVAALYHSAVGLEGCVWDAEYPTKAHAQADYQNGGLYVLTAQNDIVIAAASVEREPELNHLPFWTYPSRDAAELARVVVAPPYRGRGLSGRLLEQLFPLLRESGYTSVRLLVSTENPAALATYRRLQFAFLASCREFDLDFYACEKAL